MKSLILQVTPGINRARTTILWATLLFAALQAGAITPTYYWDINGTADGAGGASPSGTWSASAAS